MISLRYVTIPIESSTWRRHTSTFAVMPATHLVRSATHALPSRRSDSNIACASTGSMTLSWSWPASAACVIVTSLPMTLKQTWLTTSGITGFTLAGMIDDPAWSSGRLISPSPARGPEDSRRRSLQIFDSLAARRFSAEWTAR